MHIQESQREIFLRDVVALIGVPLSEVRREVARGRLKARRTDRWSTAVTRADWVAEWVNGRE